MQINNQSEWPSKSLQIINAGAGAKKREPSYTVGGNINCTQPPWREQYGGPLKKLKTVADDSVVKNPPANAGDTGLSQNWEDPTCHRATKPMCHNY